MSSSDRPCDEPWAAFERSDPGWWRVVGDFPDVFVATAIVGDRLRIIGLLIADSDAPFMLREVPVARIEASLATSARAVEWAQRQTHARSPQRLAQRLNVPAEDSYTEYPSGRSGEPLLPPTRPVPDAFYASVGEAYREFSTVTVRPVTEIAKEAGVGLRTAQGWVAEARRRKHLPPGQRGRVM